MANLINSLISLSNCSNIFWAQFFNHFGRDENKLCVYDRKIQEFDCWFWLFVGIVDFNKYDLTSSHWCCHYMKSVGRIACSRLLGIVGRKTNMFASCYKQFVQTQLKHVITSDKLNIPASMNINAKEVRWIKNLYFHSFVYSAVWIVRLNDKNTFKHSHKIDECIDTNLIDFVISSTIGRHEHGK